MLQTVTVLLTICSLVLSSGVFPAALGDHAPVVTAASSQYFERTFNRLVAAPPILEPVIPVAPVASPPPVLVETTRIVPSTTAQNLPVEPNIAIAIATAHAAAPVATILLPPYPFVPPQTIGFIPSVRPINAPEDESRKEPTTQQTTNVDATTTMRDLEATTPLPLPSNTDNSFAQPLPSKQNVNFRQYYAPPLPLLSPSPKPQKLKTSVEIVPVPLAYIAPPPIVAQHHHHTHPKPVKYVHTFLPKRARVIIRPVRVRTLRVPARLVAYRVPARNAIQNVRRPINSRESELTTFRPFNRPNTKPPRA